MEMLSMHSIWLCVLLGAGATLFMDLFAWGQKILFDLRGLNYALVGRWLLYMLKEQRFCHQNIMKAAAQPHEVLIGWIAHYAIGIVFAWLFLAIVGLNWLAFPELWSALLFGAITVVVPFLWMQPGFGLGIAASGTPTPNINRLKSLLAHISFGFGLYVTALLLVYVV